MAAPSVEEMMAPISMPSRVLRSNSQAAAKPQMTAVPSVPKIASDSGLSAARQPEGFAEAALLLGDYRKLDPSPVEEMIFFDHPSGRTRILAAMRWKANQLP